MAHCCAIHMTTACAAETFRRELMSGLHFKNCEKKNVPDEFVCQMIHEVINLIPVMLHTSRPECNMKDD